MSSGSGCWTPSGSTPWNDCGERRLRQETHNRHAAYFLALAEPAESELRGPGQLAWLGRLETRHGNLTAALSWLMDQDQIEPAVHLVWATWRFWWLHGHAEELARYVDKILDRAERLSTAPAGAGAQRIPGSSTSSPAGSRLGLSRSSLVACGCTAGRGTRSVPRSRPPCWATCSRLSTSAHGPASCWNEPSASCGPPIPAS